MSARRLSTVVRPVPVTVLMLVLVAASTIGCVPRHAAQDLEARIVQLERDNLRLRKELAEARVRLEMEREAGLEAGRRPEAAGSPRPDPLADLPAAPTEPEAPLVIYSEPITDPSGYIGGSTGGPSSSENTAALIGSAIEMLEGGRAEQAMGVFGSIVRERPEDPLADDAQFGIGEALFRMGRYREAIAAYRDVANGFPFGDQVPSAFLKMGFAHLALEQRELAMDSFRTVSEAYPGTEAATVARQQIAHLEASPTR